VKRRYVASASIRNKVYVIGGYNGTARLNAVDCLDLSDAEAHWQPVTPMHHRRGLAGACTYLGVYARCFPALKQCREYDRFVL